MNVVLQRPSPILDNGSGNLSTSGFSIEGSRSRRFRHFTINDGSSTRWNIEHLLERYFHRHFYTFDQSENTKIDQIDFGLFLVFYHQIRRTRINQPNRSDSSEVMRRCMRSIIEFTFVFVVCYKWLSNACTLPNYPK